jgi:sulfur carrier protein
MNHPTSVIDITLNGASLQLPQGASLADAATASGVRPPFAAAVNLQFVPRTQYAQTPLQDGDAVELISPITGG